MQCMAVGMPRIILTLGDTPAHDTASFACCSLVLCFSDWFFCTGLQDLWVDNILCDSAVIDDALF